MPQPPKSQCRPACPRPDETIAMARAEFQAAIPQPHSEQSCRTAPQEYDLIRSCPHSVERRDHSWTPLRIATPARHWRDRGDMVTARGCRSATTGCRGASQCWTAFVAGRWPEIFYTPRQAPRLASPRDAVLERGRRGRTAGRRQRGRCARDPLFRVLARDFRLESERSPGGNCRVRRRQLDQPRSSFGKRVVASARRARSARDKFLPRLRRFRIRCRETRATPTT